MSLAFKISLAITYAFANESGLYYTFLMFSVTIKSLEILLRNTRTVTWDKSYEKLQNIGDCFLWSYTWFLLFADAFKDPKYFFCVSIANVAVIGGIFKLQKRIRTQILT